MFKKITASVVAVLALGAGVAYAATQLQSSDGTQVCVNQTNGLMRASSTCREGESAMTIGGGSDVNVTSSGTVTVGVGATSSPVTLPLTSITVTAVCDRANAPVPDYSPDAAVARMTFSAPNGMDAVSSPGMNVGTIGGTSLTHSFQGVLSVGQVNFGNGSTIASANRATATITYGVQLSEPNKTCKFFWQAVEAPNSAPSFRPEAQRTRRGPRVEEHVGSTTERYLHAATTSHPDARLFAIER